MNPFFLTNRLTAAPSRSTLLHEDSSSEFEDDATPDDDDIDNASPPDTEDEDVRECVHPTSDDETTASDDATTNGNGDDTTTRDGVGSNQAEAWRTWGASTPWSWRDLPQGMLKGAPVSPLPERRASPERILGPVVSESICDFALNQWNQTGFFTDCEPIIEAWEELTPVSRGATVGERNAVQELRYHALQAFRARSLAIVSPQEMQLDLAHQILTRDSNTPRSLAQVDLAYQMLADQDMA
ncbi:hypothetical protein B0H14DRAFT_2603831 [Mycena olivaceomarginata]|nr:hypothetical protein B0H14DRAFT_2603831 [Mycena olivaceomarginata]